LRVTTRKKDGKEHRYWSVVENARVVSGRVAKERAMRQRQLKRLWARLRQLNVMTLAREQAVFWTPLVVML